MVSEPIDHDLDARQRTLLVLNPQELDHQLHHCRFVLTKWLRVG
jgi:hypothetical protein